MGSFEDRVKSDPKLYDDLRRTSMANRAIGRKYGVDESVIRRWRNRNIVGPEASSSPEFPHKKKTAQWTPGIDLTPDRGEMRTLPVPVKEARDTSDDDILREMGVDPNEWEIATRNESRWQNNSGEWLSAHKYTVQRRAASEGDLTVEQLNEILETYTGYPKFHEFATHANGIFVVPIADLQAGKGEGGGTAALVDRFGRMVEQARDRLINEGNAELLIIPVLGDCIEGIVSQGGKLVAQLDISVTEQVRVYRRLLMHIIAELSPYGKKVVVPVLPGNHDETYRQVIMPTHDSWAIEGASAVEDSLRLARQFDHVSFLYPKAEELVISLNVRSDEDPFVMAFTHGHLAKNPNGVSNWWSGQAFGKQHGGDADILMSGHFHHLRIEQMGGGRTWIQVPALDGGSAWFTRQTGSDEVAGMCSFWVTPGRGLNWEGFTVHTG